MFIYDIFEVLGVKEVKRFRKRNMEKGEKKMNIFSGKDERRLDGRSGLNSLREFY